jgi:hypothetical protein
MKLMLAVAMAMALGGTAGAAVPQSRLADSDDFNCNRGDPNAPITIAACYRLRNTSADPGLGPGEMVDDTGAVMGAQRVSYGEGWTDGRAHPSWRGCRDHGRTVFLGPAGVGGSVLIEGRSVRDWSAGC